MKTAVTSLLGIEHPILLGGLQWISRAPFVASVAEAGGTGFIPAASFETREDLIAEIRLAKALTQKPFGVNISMLPDASPGQPDWVIEAVLAESIPFVETSGRSPAELIPALKAANVKVIHKVTCPQHAVRAQRDGVDAIVLVGYEGGGHPGMYQVGSFVNLPATVESVSLPVIAAGGVCDRRSFAAALVLGAEGVMMGTRWIATKECPVHDNYKQWVLDADITDTLIIQRSIRNAFRAINNEKAQQVLGLEQAGTGLKELLPHVSGRKGREAIENGDMHGAVLTAGQCSGRIHEILSVRETIAQMTGALDYARLRLRALC